MNQKNRTYVPISLTIWRSLTFKFHINSPLFAESLCKIKLISKKPSMEINFVLFVLNE